MTKDVVRVYMRTGELVLLSEEPGDSLRVCWKGKSMVISLREERKETITPLPRKFPIAMTRASFHANLKQLRLQKGWSQANLATCSETAERTIRELEHGRGRKTAGLTIYQLATALEVDLLD